MIHIFTILCAVFINSVDGEQCGCPGYNHDLSNLTGSVIKYAATKESDNSDVIVSICKPLSYCNMPSCNGTVHWETCGATFDTQQWTCTENITQSYYFNCGFGFYMHFYCNYTAQNPFISYYNYTWMQFGATGHAYIATDLAC
eukprot:519233_1